MAQVFFAEINGKNIIEYIICFQGVANSFINDKWYPEHKSNNEDEAERIMITLAKNCRNKTIFTF